MRQYGLEDNRWFKDLYRDRHSWRKIYLNHLFSASNVSTLIKGVNQCMFSVTTILPQGVR